MSIAIRNLYSSVNEYNHPIFVYVINDNVYRAFNLERFEESSIPSSYTLIPAFNVDPSGSQLLAMKLGSVNMIYQLTSSRRFVELTPRRVGAERISTIGVLEVPLPNGREADGRFQRTPLRQIYPWFHSEIGRRLYLERITDFDRILEMLNERTPVAPTGLMSPVAPTIEDYRIYLPLVFAPIEQPVTSLLTEDVERTAISEHSLGLLQQSYETLLNQLYNLPITLHQFLIIDGAKASFIPFNQISSIPFERWIIDPRLQAWTGVPGTQNKIITIFARNGTTYLVKARYDQVSNQIYPPI